MPGTVTGKAHAQVELDGAEIVNFEVFCEVVTADVTLFGRGSDAYHVVHMRAQIPVPSDKHTSVNGRFKTAIVEYGGEFIIPTIGRLLKSI